MPTKLGEETVHERAQRIAALLRICPCPAGYLGLHLPGCGFYSPRAAVIIIGV